MKRKDFLTSLTTFLLVALAFVIMLLGDRIFLIVSLIFYGLAGFSEWFIIRNFYHHLDKPMEKRGFLDKVDEGTLWVNHIIKFLVSKRSTIYDYKRFGYIPAISAYVLMLFYVFAAYWLYPFMSYYAFLVYLIPIVANTFSFIVYFMRVRKLKR